METMLAHFRQPTTTPKLQGVTFHFADNITVEWRPALEDKHQLPDGMDLIVRAQMGMLYLILADGK